MEHVGVIDIGKTNAKVVVVDLARRAEIAVETTPNLVLAGPPYPHADTEAIWAFIIGALARLHAAHRIDGLVVTTHGASAALLDAAGNLAAPVLDYEYSGPETTRAAYDLMRPRFDETGSAPLPNGLNLGAQLHWMLKTDPTLKDRTARIVTWPQYWGFRLTGRASMDVTSLGCHTDLWDPGKARFSSLVERLGLTDRMAEVLAPSDRLGHLSAHLVEQTGLGPDTPVLCGIHDSNASLVPHLLDRQGPFAVVSTGTWVVSMAIDGAKVDLDASRDALVNVSAFGNPVPSARFMGGREHDLILKGKVGLATERDAARVLDQAIMLLPAVQPGSGPFPRHKSRWTVTPGETEAGLAEVATAFYLALMTAECLGMIGASGPVLVEGPFARNRFFVAMLASASGRPVHASAAQTGTAIGAALLFLPTGAPGVPLPAPVVPDAACARYALEWRAIIES